MGKNKITCATLAAGVQVRYANAYSASIGNIMNKNQTGNEPMRIWVDADACPKVVKEIIYRAADRVRINTTFVANTNLFLPHSPWLHFIRVGSGFDVADKEIARLMQPGDLVVTADIPLAADAIEQDGFALNPRGTFYTRENVKSALSMRNFMDELRGTGTLTGGPPAFSHSDRTAFANQLDRFLTRQLRD
ncbi:MAG TPA: YaiI/YqxD family protein [Mariprofundaceae bacterium]|nr:YaiI/YqxD family protein [Mariprofundaceae bacterium]